MKEQVSFRISADVIRRTRNAVAHHRGSPLFLSLDGFVEAALDKETKKLESKNGGEFPTVKKK
jgi:hypothetical protein